MPAAAGLGNLAEYQKYYDLSCLGAMMPNSIMMENGYVNGARKLYGAEYGYITSLGSNSLGIHEFMQKYARHLPWETTPLIPDLKAESLDGLVELARAACEYKEIAGVEWQVLWQCRCCSNRSKDPHHVFNQNIKHRGGILSEFHPYNDIHHSELLLFPNRIEFGADLLRRSFCGQ
ncbi:MAG: hypothetical protein MR868_03870 [Lachnospiraceae bacterium]|nr:hypothetical protein [Lachnospiraceae bacterium]